MFRFWADVDFKASDGDPNFKQYLEYGRGRHGATNISGKGNLSASLVERGPPMPPGGSAIGFI